MKKQALIVSCTIVLSSLCSGQTKLDNSSLKSLVEAERAFAKTSVEIGARPSFMMFFADDAVVFRPHPVKYKEAMKNVPAPKNPLETTLSWEPIYADIAQSGEFGYTTGPSEWTDHSAAKRPPYYGFYFSFWKKQTTGEWKVVFDVGTELPGPYNGSKSFRSPGAVERKAGREEGQLSDLMSAERNFLGSVKSEGAVKALDKHLGEGARVYRQKEHPIVGGDAIRKYFSAHPYLSTWEPMHADSARSGDLGYVYGSYTAESAGGKSGDAEKGYYLRAWKRGTDNRWKLVAEVVSPLPPEVPKSKQ